MKITWEDLLASARVKRHQTSDKEIRQLREVVIRDLKDAGVEALSADRRFATAYNAVLQLAKMVIACCGYRISGPGHHYTTFEALKIAMGSSVSESIAYFDACRRKRNQVDYDCADVISDGEAEELLSAARDFHKAVEAWIRKHHPSYSI
jgi:uncharacterized protein (UPF0332 family)